MFFDGGESTDVAGGGEDGGVDMMWIQAKLG